MQNTIAIFKALSDESRVRALMAVAERELCACQIIELLELAPSTVSKHMSILKSAGLVRTRKEGRWMYFSLVDFNSVGRIGEIVRSIIEHLKNENMLKADRIRLREIMKEDLEEICKGQRRTYPLRTLNS